ncbi:hypothetical protein M431DRAFT_460979 [Trichoderma harzianum CBS 226.95]|uniref:Uncharacterized protein n=1 Tax=Trichoderma harzianum CBS 226.95 TaxID=983964 RepID=A0A2T4A8M0_TRIHA|nr:hypothetical protein M431DRAFT_460979 [Trichoderma harzianum CBS 226.95]PTB53358.1 hypothetical protein M431DRAFT_460979 [Trichoderma harzianum CBS 226.95]
MLPKGEGVNVLLGPVTRASGGCQKGRQGGCLLVEAVRNKRGGTESASSSVPLLRSLNIGLVRDICGIYHGLGADVGANHLGEMQRRAVSFYLGPSIRSTECAMQRIGILALDRLLYPFRCKMNPPEDPVSRPRAGLCRSYCGRAKCRDTARHATQRLESQVSYDCTFCPSYHDRTTRKTTSAH